MPEKSWRALRPCAKDEWHGNCYGGSLWPPGDVSPSSRKSNVASISSSWRSISSRSCGSIPPFSRSSSRCFRASSFAMIFKKGGVRLSSDGAPWARTLAADSRFQHRRRSNAIPSPARLGSKIKPKSDLWHEAKRSWFRCPSDARKNHVGFGAERTSNGRPARPERSLLTHFGHRRPSLL
jgi:hypothetical protein